MSGDTHFSASRSPETRANLDAGEQHRSAGRRDALEGTVVHSSEAESDGHTIFSPKDIFDIHSVLMQECGEIA
jgi:hypothetical protein